MRAALSRARAWLRAQRNADASYGYTPGAPGRPEPSILVAAAGLEAPLDWLEARELGWAGRLAPLLLRAQPGSEALRQRELTALRAQRSETGATTADFDASLPAWGWVPHTAGWTEPTAHALLALRAAGLHDDVRAAEAAAFLLDRQGIDGGWNYGNPRILGRELESAPVATGWALLALSGQPSASAARGRGLAWLEARCAGLPTAHSLALLALAQAQLGADPRATAATLALRARPDASLLGRIDLTALACAAWAATLGEPVPLLLGEG